MIGSGSARAPTARPTPKTRARGRFRAGKRTLLIMAGGCSAAECCWRGRSSSSVSPAAAPRLTRARTVITRERSRSRSSDTGAGGTNDSFTSPCAQIGEPR
jgi:hypothetical protein